MATIRAKEEIYTMELDKTAEELELEKAEKEKADNPETETFTKEEFEKQLQSQTDKRVTEALKTSKEKWLAEFDAEKTEAEKLAGLTAEERARVQFQKEKDAWEQEKTSFEAEKLKLEATKILSAEGLPISFVDYVATGNAEQITENIKVFKEAWETALDEAVTGKLKGKTPSSGLQNKDIVNMTKAEFGKLPYKERSKMLSIDPDIVSKLK